MFYYLISNLMTGIQQKYILGKREDQMEASADRKILRDLKKIEEGQVVDEPKSDRWVKSKNVAKSEDGKAGVNVTRISVKSRKGHKKKRS